jgi:hypothetical protein
VVGPVRPRILESRADCERLSEFRVGEEKRSEREVTKVVKLAVDEMARSAAEGRAAVRTTVALEAESSSWVGVSVINPLGNDPYPGIAYIEGIGTACGYRECRLSDELTRPGTALILGTVEAVAHLAGVGREALPAMSAWVLPTNRPSRYMFAAGGFVRLLAQDVGCPQEVWLRRPGERLKLLLPASVYIPLTK